MLLVLGGGNGTVYQQQQQNQPTLLIMQINQRITAPSTVRESRGATITQDRAAGVVVSGVRSATATVTNPASRNETPQYQNINIVNTCQQTPDDILPEANNTETNAPNRRLTILVDFKDNTLPSFKFTENESFHGLSKCNRCSVCQLVNNNVNCLCSVTNKKFITQNNIMDCNTTNIIYLITCTKCKVQYIGETGRSLRERIREHVRSIKRNELNTCLVKHFNKPNHSCNDVSVQILQQLGNNINKTDRIKLEAFWIRLFNTAYPLGLNSVVQDKYGKSTIINTYDMDINKLFKINPLFTIKCPRRPRKRGRKKKCSEKSVKHDLINDMKDAFSNTEYRRLYTALRTMNNKTKNFYWEQISTLVTDEKLKLVVMAFLLDCMDINRNNKDQQNRSAHRISVPFTNKIIERMRLQSIFNTPIVKRINDKYNIAPVQIVYTYNQPIGSFVLTHSKIIKQSSMQELLKIANTTCNCANSSFVDAYHKHIITGDLDIIQDIHVRKLLKYGNKHRLNRNLNMQDVTDIFTNIQQTYMQIIRGKYKVSDIECTAVEQHFTDYFNKMQTRFTCHFPAKGNHRRINLNSQFVYAPADKAANNIVIICAKYYVQTILHELGSTNGRITGNNTYEYLVNVTPTDIINKHNNYLHNYNIPVKPDNLFLPTVYALPKLHKNPSKWRIIAAAKKSSLKPLNVLIMNVLSFFKNHFKNYCTKIMERTGQQTYCSILNSTEVCDWIICNQNRIQSIYTADFSTLYTTLPHHIVKNAMINLIMLCFKNAGKKFITITGNGNRRICKYTNVPCADTKVMTLRPEEVLTLVEFIIDENYINIGNNVFRQKCGIPMGGNSSPLLADMCLSWYEYIYLKSNNTKPFKLFRYIDDILVINTPDCTQILREIYGDELQLERTNNCIEKGQYLDLNISTKPSLTLTVYDKTRDFNFPVIKFPNIDSCITSSIVYNCMYAQLLRFGRICNHLDQLVFNSKRLYNELLLKGADKTRLHVSLLRFCHRYSGMMAKFGIVNKKDILIKFYNCIIN